MTRSLCPPICVLFCVAGLVTAPAEAQLAQVCLALNESGPGIEYCSAPNKTGLEGNLAYTIEAWIHPTSFDGFPTIVGNNYLQSYWLGLNTLGKVRFYPRGGAGQFVETDGSVPLNRWTHVAAVYSAWVGHSIYINGELASSGTTSGVVGTSSGDLRIGADREGSEAAYFWRGYLDEIRIWSEPRTRAQIRETMYVAVGNRGWFASGVYDALEANWTVTEASLTSMPDLATSSHSAAFVNGDRGTHTTHGYRFGPPVAPSVAIQLNGVDDHVVMPVTEAFDRGVTVKAWIAPLDHSVYAGFPTIAGRDFTESFWLGLNNAGMLRFYPTGGLFNYVDGTIPIEPRRWTHVAATYANGRTVLYVNGRVDVISDAVSGPVGANGRDVLIGADNGSYGLGYPFAGWLDEVQVVQGALSAPDVRREMYQGFASFSNPFERSDEQGVLVDSYHASFDTPDYLDVFGTGARLVRAGTAAVDYYMAILDRRLEEFAMRHVATVDLPDEDSFASLGTAVIWPLNHPIAHMEVFLSAPITSLEKTRIRLQSPTGTTVDLLSLGDAVGRDLLTVFDDNLQIAWATGYAPYHTGVRPSQPLSAFSGEDPAGGWFLILDAFSGARVSAWTWGLRINGAALDVPAGAAGRDLGLRFAGANPTRGTGSVAFDLPRAARVDLALHDLQGRRVQSILEGEREAGAYAMHFPTAGLSPGVYLVRLAVDGAGTQTLKLTVTR